MFKFVLLKPSLHQLIVMMKSTIIHFKQYLIAAQFLEQKLIFLIKTFLYRYIFNLNNKL
jgi:hypothetical protein